MAGHTIPPVASAPFFSCPAGATFDGSATKIGRNSAGITAPTSVISFSVWVKLVGGNGSDMDILNIGSGSNGTILRRNASNRFFIQGNGSASRHFDITSSTSYTSGSAWVHVLGALNTNLAAGSKLGTLYVNGVADGTITYDSDTAFSMQSTGASANGPVTGIGASQAGSNFFNGSIAQLWVDTGNYVDFTVLANRRKFLTASKRPVFLGSSGLRPTGSCGIYLNGAGTGFNVNSGDAGAYTTSGTLTTPTSTPSSP